MLPIDPPAETLHPQSLRGMYAIAGSFTASHPILTMHFRNRPDGRTSYGAGSFCLQTRSLVSFVSFFFVFFLVRLRVQEFLDYLA